MRPFDSCRVGSSSYHEVRIRETKIHIWIPKQWLPLRTPALFAKAMRYVIILRGCCASQLAHALHCMPKKILWNGPARNDANPDSPMTSPVSLNSNDTVLEPSHWHHVDGPWRISVWKLESNDSNRNAAFQGTSNWMRQPLHTSMTQWTRRMQGETQRLFECIYFNSILHIEKAQAKKGIYSVYIYIYKKYIYVIWTMFWLIICPLGWGSPWSQLPPRWEAWGIFQRCWRWFPSQTPW